MKPPPFVLMAALLFWGWRTGFLWVGLITGLLLELSHHVRARWDFTDKELNRLWDVCTVLFLAAAAYLRFAQEISSAAYKFFQWMPLIFFPMALGDAFSSRAGVPAKAFSWFLRVKSARGGDRPIAFSWIYFCIVLITSGATNDRDIWFYIGISLLTGAALWSIRPGRLPTWGWCTLFLVVAGAGFFGQSRMQDLQSYFETKASEFFVQFGRREPNPAQSQTAMGRIGSLKQSSRIVMKVIPEYGRIPERLRQCSYARLDGTVWRSRMRDLEPVSIGPDATTWTLITNAPSSNAVRIIERVSRRDALLSVPFGTTELAELNVAAVETNFFAVIRANGNPGLLNYVARFGQVSSDIAGREWDLIIAPEERRAIERIAQELNIDSYSPDRKIAAIVRFFAEKFRYTTYQAARQLGLYAETPLAEFLLKHRAGHCEYFATATVLLLRHYGIPARYATGYSIQELSLEEGEDNAYVIRERHGHAWTLAFLNGKWQEVDSTPSGWEMAEAQEFPWYQNLKDDWESFAFSFLEWRWLGDWGFFRFAAPWLTVPLCIILIWRIFGRRLKRSAQRFREMQDWPGADSEFFDLERQLIKVGLNRNNEETNAQWLARINAEAPTVAPLLNEILTLHYKYRFHPNGISRMERQQLRKHVGVCLSCL